jgi:chromosome segregation ATPase
MQMLKFTQFVNEAQIKDKVLTSKLDRIHEIKERLKELTAETKSIEGELKEFDASIKPVFDAMKVLNDKLALTEKYVIKITRYGGEGTAIAYGKAVEQALTQVDEAAQAIINECVRVNTAVTSVKHSYDIQKVDESKLSDKVKAIVAKFSDKIRSAVEKFKSVFATKTAKIDQANQKLAGIVK